MSSVITSKTDRNGQPVQHRPRYHQRRGREQTSLRSSAGSILGKSKRRQSPYPTPQAQGTPSPRESRRLLIVRRDILTEHRLERLEGNEKTNLQSTGLVVTKEKDLKKSRACLQHHSQKTMYRDRNCISIRQSLKSAGQLSVIQCSTGIL